MAKAITPDNHADLQMRVMTEVARAIYDAAGEMCMRDGNMQPAVARWILSEAATMSMMASFAQLGEKDIFALAARLATEAVVAVQSGAATQIEKPTAEEIYEADVDPEC